MTCLNKENGLDRMISEIGERVLIPQAGMRVQAAKLCETGRAIATSVAAGQQPLMTTKGRWTDLLLKDSELRKLLVEPLE